MDRTVGHLDQVFVTCNCVAEESLHMVFFYHFMPLCVSIFSSYRLYFPSFEAGTRSVELCKVKEGQSCKIRYFLQ